MKDLISALGLLLFLEGLFLAIFPTKIKNMINAIDKIPKNKLRRTGIFSISLSIFLILVGKMAKNNPSIKRSKPRAVNRSFMELN